MPLILPYKYSNWFLEIMIWTLHGLVFCFASARIVMTCKPCENPGELKISFDDPGDPNMEHNVFLQHPLLAVWKLTMKQFCHTHVGLYSKAQPPELGTDIVINNNEKILFIEKDPVKIQQKININ